jgi:hypothetical protein
MPKRLLYDGLQPNQHTFTYDEVPDGEGGYAVVGQPDIKAGAIVEVADLEHPTSERARICRDHIARGLARVLEGEAPAATSAAPAKVAKNTKKDAAAQP